MIGVSATKERAENKKVYKDRVGVTLTQEEIKALVAN
jgi:hypothetical protein